MRNRLADIVENESGRAVRPRRGKTGLSGVAVENTFSRSTISGASLARNVTFNLAGQFLPLFAGVLLIPYIVRGLGPERFGLLGIIWVVFGYFNLMDFGLGRATTKFLAEMLARQEEGIPEMVWSSIAVQALLGVLGGGILALLTPVLVGRVLKTPVGLESEARATFYILAGALPAVLVASGFRAVLEGCQRFDIANLLRIPSSMLAFVIPAMAVAGGMKLPGVLLWMAITRLGFTLAHGYYCLRVLPSLRLRPAIRLSVIRPLLSFGGWVTVSNAINPILLSMDRFLIGAVLSVAMVGYYTAPMEAITKLWMVPTSLMTTVYPACSALGINRIRELQSIYSRSIKYLFCALAPVSLCLVLFARPIISAWLGQTFADKSAVPLQFLAVGVFLNCFAHVPYSFLQALGRPGAAAKLFLCELLPFGLLAWVMTKRFGISGTAAAWSIRVAIEVLLLLWLARRLVRVSFWHALDRRMASGFVALCVFGVGVYATKFFLHDKPGWLAAVCIVWLAGFGLIAWKQVLDDTDRASVLAVLQPLRNSFEQSLGSAAAD